MSDNDDNLPWEAEVLASGPVIITEATQELDIVDALEEKLEAVMGVYECGPTPEGWRKLALHLFLDMQEGRRVVAKTPFSRREPGEPGRPPADPVWMWRMGNEIAKAKRLEKPITAKQAAERVNKSHNGAPSVKTLQTRYLECDDIKYTFPSPDFELMRRAEEALNIAACNLESRSRK